MAQTSFYSVRYTPSWPPVLWTEYNDPDSEYWHGEAVLAGKLLEARMGTEAFCSWYEAQDETDTWRALASQVNAKLTEVNYGK